MQIIADDDNFFRQLNQINFIMATRRKILQVLCAVQYCTQGLQIDETTLLDPHFYYRSDNYIFFRFK